MFKLPTPKLDNIGLITPEAVVGLLLLFKFLIISVDVLSKLFPESIFVLKLKNDDDLDFSGVWV